MDQDILNTLYNNLNDYKNSKEFAKSINDEIEGEKALKTFINRFGTEKKIRKMSLDDYCVGKGNKESFSYMLDYSLWHFGDIKGQRGNSIKFGIYYSNKSKDYISSSHNTSIDDKFNEIKDNIIKIMNMDASLTGFDQISFDKADLVKNKLLYLYHPGSEKIPIHNPKHLINILNYFGVVLNGNENISELRHKLYQFYQTYIASRPEFNLISPIRFTDFLYNGPKTDSYKQILYNNKIPASLSGTHLNTNNQEIEIKTIADQDDINQDKIYQVLGYDMNSEEFNQLCNKEPTPPSGSHDNTRYPTDPKMGRTAFEHYGFSCAIDSSHITFTSKSGFQYVEAHHLIPMSAQRDFKNQSLDIVANIVPLCPNCHAAIHRGDEKTRKALVKKLYDLRINDLEQAGLDITFDDLFNKYYK